ncbi:hypothetical protein [Paucibacter sp. B51]|uniref:hypothetical protein n=1 Tax=Paucibacter sp. B51 TaxID=2993315 RepID=UPI0022EBCEBE|nr:hypothetical protein [Paucibacter sp. B51]
MSMTAATPTKDPQSPAPWRNWALPLILLASAALVLAVAWYHRGGPEVPARCARVSELNRITPDRDAEWGYVVASDAVRLAYADAFDQLAHLDRVFVHYPAIHTTLSFRVSSVDVAQRQLKLSSPAMPGENHPCH